MRTNVDVLIVGAGLSGIGAACHLRRQAPDRSFAILESRGAIGGTWDLFRYPGIRSDSDMHTLGYAFAPWKDGTAIAEGPSIRNYVIETAAEYGVDKEIRFHHRVTTADWDSATSSWTVHVERTDTGEHTDITCGFLFFCSGYYDYAAGYAPQIPGADRFGGRLVHPQHWPEDLDYAGKRVVIIGSGATAITLVPAMAPTAEHVTMLQRSPSYIVSLPSVDPLANLARRLLPEKLAYHLVRIKNVGLMTLSFQLSRRRPRLMKALIRRGARSLLPAGYDVDRHFAPRYDPWDQRLCVAPDADLFRALSNGSASIVTDTIESFTERGLALTSGEELAADVVVTATGLRMQALGGAALTIDGAPVSLPETVAYRGAMLSGVPNFAMTIGYANASWTLRADLTADYVCRLLNHMAAHGYRECRPAADPPGIDRRPLLDLSSGYVLRSVRDLPSQGSRRPWRMRQNYALDLLDIRRADLEDGVMRFSTPAPAAHAQPAAAIPT
jgi:cation diffusion facilitator CzcD-associated flavoprotein CzcO